MKRFFQMLLISAFVVMATLSVPARSEAWKVTIVNNCDLPVQVVFVLAGQTRPPEHRYEYSVSPKNQKDIPIGLWCLTGAGGLSIRKDQKTGDYIGDMIEYTYNPGFPPCANKTITIENSGHKCGFAQK
ncbi:MAG: hypothetical protein WCP20_09840 [Desulfuromonadales bacterium]